MNNELVQGETADNSEVLTRLKERKDLDSKNRNVFNVYFMFYEQIFHIFMEYVFCLGNNIY